MFHFCVKQITKTTLNLRVQEKFAEILVYFWSLQINVALTFPSKHISSMTEARIKKAAFSILLQHLEM